MKRIFLLIVLFAVITNVLSSDSAKDSEILSRQKRFLLIFNNGGLIKAVMGISCPVMFNDRTKRTLGMSYNFQSQYRFNPNYTSPLEHPIFTGLQRRLKRQKSLNKIAMSSEKDDSRKLLYSLLKLTMERRGIDGEQCLFRAICEVAESSYKHNGLFGELIDLIFTPQEDELGPEFTAARTIGLRGGNCQSSFSKCAPGDGLLDSISMIM